MNKNIQPGSCVEVKGEVEKLFLAAKWENLIYKLENRHFVYLMGEFYCNMRPIRGLEGVMHITTIVGGRPILVDHKVINRALKFPHKLTDLPCIDIYSHFVFDKNEFQLYVSYFCDSDVPLGMFESNVGVHYKHFTPVYQLVALIVRANVLPKPNQDKFFDFHDLKLMFMLVTDSVDFNLSYVILLNMINAHIMDFMPYGNLLSAVLSIYHVTMPLVLETRSTSFISSAHVRTPVPLDKCEPEQVELIRIPPYIDEEDIYLADNSSVLKMFEEQKVEMKKLRDENIQIMSRVTYLEGVAAASIGNSSRQMDVDFSHLYQVSMTSEGYFINDVDMYHEIEAVGVGIGGQGSQSMMDFNFVGTSFMGAMEEAMN
ncbi:hypothetical protein ACET3Z_025654 [Daucus carota]